MANIIKWEYLKLINDEGDRSLSEKELNDEGEKGWQLLSYHSETNTHKSFAVFKRMKLFTNKSGTDSKRYYYFETAQELEVISKVGKVGHKLAPSPLHFQNSNRLVHKPNLNSEGVWQFTNFPSKPRDLLVDQYWVDLDMYKFGSDVIIDYWVTNILKTIENETV